MTRRFIQLDIARIFCIVLVVIGHYSPNDAPLWYTKINAWIYSFHMPVFLFLSGYLYKYDANSLSGYFQLLTKKAKRLLLPYFIVSIFVISIKLLSQRFGVILEHPVTLFSYIRMLYLPEAGYYMWFIVALWWMFVFTPLLTSRISQISCLIIVIVLHFLPFELPSLFCLNEFKSYYVWFLLGVCTKSYWKVTTCDKYTDIYYIFPAISSIVIIAWISFFINEFSYFGRNELFALVGIVAVMLISSLISSVLSKRNKFVVSYCSSSVYWIYLLHTTFEGVAKVAVNHVSGISFVPSAILVVVSGLFFPFIIYLITHPFHESTNC